MKTPAIIRSVKPQIRPSVPVIWMAGLILITAAMPSRAATFSDSLANGRNTNIWLLSETTPGLYSFDDTQGNFALAKTALLNPGGLQRETLKLNLANLGGNITGDFSTQVSFTNAVLPNTTGSAWNQVQFELIFQDGSFFMLRRTTNPNMIDVYSSANGYVGAFASTATVGSFSFVRTGTTLSAYFNGGLVFAESKSATLTNVQYVLQNHSTDDAISVAYERFSLSAASVFPFLSISAVTNGAAITWPSGFTNFALKTTFSLTPPVAWDMVTHQAQIGDGSVSIIIATDVPTRFFRLEQSTP